MRLHSDRSQKQPLAKPLPCAQCGHDLILPAWSERIAETRIRYLWTCYACGYEFETTVFLAPVSQAA